MNFQENIHYSFMPDFDNNIMLGTNDDWCVVLRGPYEGIIGKYKNIVIRDKGQSLRYDFDISYVPADINFKQDRMFDDFVKRVLLSIIKLNHEKNKGFELYSVEQPT